MDIIGKLAGWTMGYNDICQGIVIINHLRAKCFRGSINIYLHFMSLLHIDMAQVL